MAAGGRRDRRLGSGRPLSARRPPRIAVIGAAITIAIEPFGLRWNLKSREAEVARFILAQVFTETVVLDVAVAVLGVEGKEGCGV